jgi:phosphatidylinositol 4-kinase A
LFTGIPHAEKFSFCLNTLLSDIAVTCPEQREEIIVNQVEVLGTLTNMIKSSKENNAMPPMLLCKATVPLLLGLGRSMGRYAPNNGPPLLCRLFPRADSPAIKATFAQIDTKQTSLNHFRSIIPRSMSGSLSVDSSEIASPKVSVGKNRLQTFYSVPYDPTTYFFSKYGSSFNQFPNMRFFETPVKKVRINFPISHLQTIFALAKKLLTKETLEHLDEQAGDVYALHQIKPYGYKSFSETINLVMVTLLRELLQNQTGICVVFLFGSQVLVQLFFVLVCHRLASTIHQRCARVCEAFVFDWANRVAE